MDKAKRDLPTPVMGDEVYLAAILDELVGLRADMARAPEPEPEAVKEFREPAPKKRQSVRRGKG